MRLSALAASLVVAAGYVAPQGAAPSLTAAGHSESPPPPSPTPPAGHHDEDHHHHDGEDSDAAASPPPAPSNCGYQGQTACTYQDDAGDTINSCYSDGHPTVGAVPTMNMSSGDISYSCEECGRPFEHACECTHDDAGSGEATDAVYVNPCDINGMGHWCLFQPQYIATVDESNGFYYCVHNDTDTEEELSCGTEGREACLDIVTGVYSCLSPSSDGATIVAVQDPPDSANSPFLCERANTEAKVRAARTAAATRFAKAQRVDAKLSRKKALGKAAAAKKMIKRTTTVKRLRSTRQ